jgi:hypothetical protein
MFYAKEWPCGLAVSEVRQPGYNARPKYKNVVNVARFHTRKERDEWVYNWTAPNHSPSAFAEPVKASDEDIRRELKSDCPYFTNENE